jgi:colicin import membrane protein
MRRLQMQEDYSAAIFWSVVLHAGIALLLVFRFHWGSPELPSIGGEVIEAMVVDVSVLEAIEQRKELQQQKQVRQREAERQAEEQKLRAAQERKIALQLQKEKEQKAAEQKRKAEEKRKQDEARKIEEREQLEVAKQHEQERLQAEAAATARAQAQRDDLASARGLYHLAIQQKVTRNWMMVPSAVTGQVCYALIRQIPGGEVISVEMEKCDGDAALERSVEQAIYMASPLPEPPDPRVFERAIRIIFVVP